MNPIHIASVPGTVTSITMPGVPAVAGLGRIDFGCAGVCMTAQEFDAVTDYDEAYPYELIRGVLVANPIPSDGEAGPNELLGTLLFVYQRSHPQGFKLDATLPERNVPVGDNRRRADRSIWIGLGRYPNSEIDVPTIVVEFVSPGRRDWTRDYIERRKEYREAGVKEYWVIDRFQRCMTVYRFLEKDEAEIVVAAHEVYRPQLLPGFELPLAQLLASIDAFGPST